MGTSKNELKKKVLDVLKQEITPISEAENSQLTGGFAAGGAELGIGVPIDDINVPCNNKECTTNSVAGCGAK